MVKIITFHGHVGKNDVKLRGDWTHDPMKEKKSYLKWDLNLEPLGPKSKTLPLSYGDMLHYRHYKTLQIDMPMIQF